MDSVFPEGAWERAGAARGFEKRIAVICDDTALVADSEEKLCRLLSGFCGVCES